MKVQDEKEKAKVKEMLKVDWVPYPADLVVKIDKIIEMAKGSSGYVQTEADLKVLRALFEVFVRYYPQAATDLYNSVQFFKAHEKDGGIGKEGSAMVQHQLEMPEKLYLLIKAVYPNQSWDRKFIRRLISVIPEVKATKGGI